jgi:large subunit ribosomal protein L27
MGKDHTLYALMAGKVVFAVKGPLKRKCVSIEPIEIAEDAVA